MKESTSRRLFLQKSAIVTTGLTLLSSNVVNAFSDESPFEGYNPYMEEKTDLRTTIFEKHVRVKGVVYESNGLVPIQDATIEVWHLSPGSKKFRHRGKLYTNSQGEYNFITDFPERKTAETTKIYFKLTHKGKSVFTEMGLDASGAYITSEHWQRNQHLGEKLFPTSNTLLNTQTINFNLSI